MRVPRWRPTSFAALVALLAVRPLVAETLPLPLDRALDADVISLELRGADVAVTVDAGAEPRLTVQALGEAASGTIDVTSMGRELSVATPSGDPAPTRVVLRLSTEQRLRLDGTEVSLRIDGSRPAVPEEPLAAPGAPPAEAASEPRVRLTLDSSEADLAGLAGLELVATDSKAWLRETSGSLVLDLRRGSAEVQTHAGKVSAKAAEAEVALLDVRGNVELELTGGSLRLAEGFGRVTGTARDADVQLSGWTGGLELTAQGGRLDARDTDRFEAPWKLEATDLSAVLEHLRGPLDAKLHGGDFEVSDVEGAVSLTADGGAELDGARLVTLRLKLADGASARLSDLARLLLAETEDATLRVDGVGILAVTASRSQITASRVETLRELTATDSDLVLDLTETTRIPAIELKGQGTASVSLRTPCVVSPERDDPSLADQIWVTSCDLRLAGQQVRPVYSRLIYGHREPSVLRLDLSEDVSVTVEGRTTE